MVDIIKQILFSEKWFIDINYKILKERLLFVENNLIEFDDNI